jgi:sigma-B regulation protein RsbU (phosphoserine phosphatase)
MKENANIERQLSTLSGLESQLHLKQLQINKLLNITQAINNNLPADALYSMYHSFMSWEMGVEKMALFTQKEKEWQLATSVGMEEDVLNIGLNTDFSQFDRMRTLKDIKDPFIQHFDVVIPVLHKENPIAYAFIGDCAEESDEFYNKIQFITTITNIIAVAIENKRLFKQQLEQVRFKKEIELASEMQQMMVPNTLPDDESFSLDSIYIPQIGVGGDYFDVIQTTDDSYIFCVADISGKGFAAALLMSNVQANLKTLAELPLDMSELIRSLNKVIYKVTKGDKYITMFIAEYNVSKKELTYVNAGHVAPFFIEGKEISCLKEGCMILGAFEELPFVDVGYRKIKDKAKLLAFTDGLTDLRNTSGDYFNEHEVEKFISENYSLPVAEINQRLMAKIEAFKSELSYPDDITILTCKMS